MPTVVLVNVKKYWLQLGKKIEQCAENMEVKNLKRINVKPESLCSEVSLTVQLHKTSTKWLEFEVDKELCKNDL